MTTDNAVLSVTTFTKSLRSSSILTGKKITIAGAVLNSDSVRFPRKLQHLLSWTINTLAAPPDVSDLTNEERSELWELARAIYIAYIDRNQSPNPNKRKRTSMASVPVPSVFLTSKVSFVPALCLSYQLSSKLVESARGFASLITDADWDAIITQTSVEEIMDLLAAYLNSFTTFKSKDLQYITNIISSGFQGVTSRKRLLLLYLDKCLRPLQNAFSADMQVLLPLEIQNLIQQVLFPLDILIDFNRSSDIAKMPFIKTLKASYSPPGGISPAVVAFCFKCFLSSIKTYSSLVFTKMTKALVETEDTNRKRHLISNVFGSLIDILLPLFENDERVSSAYALMIHHLDASKLLTPANDEFYRQYTSKLRTIAQKSIGILSSRSASNFRLLQAIMETEYDLVKDHLDIIMPHLASGSPSFIPSSSDFTVALLKTSATANSLQVCFESWLATISGANKYSQTELDNEVILAFIGAIRVSLTLSQAVTLLEGVLRRLQALNYSSDLSAHCRLASFVNMSSLILRYVNVPERKQHKLDEEAKRIFEEIHTKGVVGKLSTLDLNKLAPLKCEQLISELNALWKLLSSEDVLYSAGLVFAPGKSIMHVLFEKRLFKDDTMSRLAVTFLHFSLTILDNHENDRECTKNLFSYAIQALKNALETSRGLDLWSGKMVEISTENVGSAIFRVLVEDDLCLAEAAADDVTLSSFMAVLLSFAMTNGSLSCLAKNLLLRADFWERSRLRSAFIKDFIALLYACSEGSNWCDLDNSDGALSEVTMITKIMMLLPVGSLTRQERNRIAELVSKLGGGGKSRSSDIALVARKCLLNFLIECDSLCGLDVNVLVNDEWNINPIKDRDSFFETTINLTNLFIKYHRAMTRDEDNDAEGFWKTVSQYGSLIASLDRFTSDILRDEQNLTSRDWIVLMSVPEYLFDEPRNVARRFIEADVSDVSSSLTQTMMMLRVFLTFNKAVFVKDMHLAGTRLCAKLLPKVDSAAVSYVFKVLIEVFELSRLIEESIIPCDISLALFCCRDVKWISEECVKKVFSNLSEAKYKEVGVELLKGLKSLRGTSLTRILHIVPLLIEGHPESASATASSLLFDTITEVCCVIMRPIQGEHFRDAVAYLQALERLVNIRHSVLHERDIALILTALTSWLAPCVPHIQETDYTIFDTIYNTLHPIIRHHRHILLRLLPLITRLAQCMIRILAAPRTDVMIPSGFIAPYPVWMRISQASGLLGTREAEMVSRLLTTLCWKTPLSSTRTATVSLVKPFAKHAACILGEFIHTETDDLYRISIESMPFRKGIMDALNPGLWALCEIIGRHERDALMVTLDTTGKAILQTLWADWVKFGKYRGQ